MDLKRIHSTTSIPIETIDLQWNIENFELVFKMALDKENGNDSFPALGNAFAELPFNASGAGSGTSEWKIFLIPNKDKYVDFFLRLEKASTPESEYKVSYNIYLEDRNGVRLAYNDIDVLHTYKDEDGSDTWGIEKFVTVNELRTKYLKDDVLHLNVEVKILGDTTTDTQYYENHMLEGHQHALESIAGHLETGFLADVTFSIKNLNSDEATETEVKAHKLMLSAQSPVFETMFKTEMKETVTNVVAISDVSPEAFNLMIHIMYTGRIKKEWETLAPELMYLADKYQFENLKDFLDRNIPFAITLDNALELLKAAKLFKLTKAEQAIEQYTKAHWKHFLDKMI